MERRNLGKTELSLSEITLGTWGLSSECYGPISPLRFTETVKSAIEHGVDTFDLSPIWGEGSGERRIGEILRKVGQDGVIITRGGARLIDSKLQHTFGEEELVADCEASLKRLERETIDLFLLHNPGEEALGTTGWRAAVEGLKEAGKIRAWGVSVGDVDEARMAISAGAEAICLPHNLMAADDLDDLEPELAHSGCGVLARSPLAYGLLAGHWNEDRRFREHDQRGRRWNQTAFAERIRQVEDLRFLLQSGKHADMATASLRFVLSHPRVTAAVIGARNPYQASAAGQAATGAPYLDGDELAKLAKTRYSAGI